MNESEMSLDAMSELRDSGVLEVGKPIIITMDGREHNIVVTNIGRHYLCGYVATNKFLLLYSENKNPQLRAQILGPEESRNIHAAGHKVILDTACIVGCPELKMSAQIKQIKLFESPWRPFVAGDIIDAEGNVVKPEAAIKAIKGLADYHLGDGRFVESPGAWPRENGAPAIKLVTPDDESSEEQPAEKGKGKKQ